MGRKNLFLIAGVVTLLAALILAVKFGGSMMTWSSGFWEPSALSQDLDPADRDAELERSAARAAGIPLTPGDLHALLAGPGRDYSQDYQASAHLWDVERLYSSDVPWQAAHRIRIESYMLAMGGRYREAIENQALGFQLERTDLDRGSRAATLEARQLDTMNWAGVQDILELGGADPNVAKSVLEMVENQRKSVSSRRLLFDTVVRDESRLGELRAEGTDGLTGFVSGAELEDVMSDSARMSPSESQHFGDVVLAAEADYLHHVRWMLRTNSFGDDSLSAGSRWDADLTWEPYDSTGSELVRLMELDDIQARVAVRANEAVNSAGATILVDRARSGHLPTALPPGFRDPYSGKPLGYRREGSNGFVVYCLGAAGPRPIDDGTVSIAQAGAIEAGAFLPLFRWPLPPQLAITTNLPAPPRLQARFDQATRDVMSERAAAARNGIDLESGSPQPPPRMGLDAAPIYRNIAALIHEARSPFPMGQAYEPTNGMQQQATGVLPTADLAGFARESLSEMRETLSRNAELMTRIHEAVSKPYCDFADRWPNHPSEDVPGERNLALTLSVYLLCMQSYLLAKDGRFRDAIANQTLGFQIANHAAQDRSLTEYILSHDLELMNYAGLHDLLDIGASDPAKCDLVRAAIRNHPWAASFRTNLMHSVASVESQLSRQRKNRHPNYQFALNFDALLLGLQSNLLSTSGQPANTYGLNPYEAGHFDRVMDAVEARYLKQVRQLLEAVTAGNHAINYTMSHFDGSPRCQFDLIVRQLAQSYMPFGTWGDAESDVDAEAAVLSAAAAVLKVSAQTGSLPPALPPGVPHFTPRHRCPIRYRRMGPDGFQVFCGGTNGIFQGQLPDRIHLPQFTWPSPGGELGQ